MQQHNNNKQNVPYDISYQFFSPAFLLFFVAYVEHYPSARFIERAESEKNLGLRYCWMMFDEQTRSEDFEEKPPTKEDRLLE